MRFTARPRMGGRRAVGRWRRGGPRKRRKFLMCICKKVVCVSIDLTCFCWEGFADNWELSSFVQVQVTSIFVNNRQPNGSLSNVLSKVAVGVRVVGDGETQRRGHEREGDQEETRHRVLPASLRALRVQIEIEERERKGDWEEKEGISLSVSHFWVVSFCDPF